MPFVRNSLNTVDAERGITVSQIFGRYTGSTESLPFKYQNDIVQFEFWVSETYQNRTITDKCGKEHIVQHPINVYIIEKGLRGAIDEAHNKSGRVKISDEEYIKFKTELSEAMAINSKPELGVEFINSPSDKGITDNFRSTIIPSN